MDDRDTQLNTSVGVSGLWKRLRCLHDARIRLLLCAVSVAAVSACGQKSTFDVSVTDYSFALERSSVAPGEITFRLTNEGNEDHEFAVIRTDVSPESLPIRDEEWVDEDASGLTWVGGFDHLLPGRTKELQLTLDPGSYVLLCNMQGHYQLGMFAPLAVSAAN